MALIEKLHGGHLVLWGRLGDWTAVAVIGKRIAEAGMWESARTVELYYIGDESDLVEAGVRGLEFGSKIAETDRTARDLENS